MKILVAEDDVPLAAFLQQRLGQEQFTVQIAFGFDRSLIRTVRGVGYQIHR